MYIQTGGATMQEKIIELIKTIDDPKLQAYIYQLIDELMHFYKK